MINAKISKGFTFIELLLTIAFLAVLAVGILTLINPVEQISKANDSRRKSDLEIIKTAVDTYYNDFGSYPTSNASYEISGVAWGASWQPYLSQVPKDKNGRTFVYYSPPASNGQTYYLYTSLERGGKDINACNPDGSACLNVPMGVVCGGNASMICNYGVSSPNVTP